MGKKAKFSCPIEKVKDFFFIEILKNQKMAGSGYDLQAGQQLLGELRV